MLRSRLVHLALALGLLPAVPLGACELSDFMAMPLPASERPAVALALELAYPGLRVDEMAGKVILADGDRLPLGRDTGRTPRDILADASIAEQFVQVYPLAFDLSARETPWFDPGRFRNDAFFRALWFNDEASAARSLVSVRYPRKRAQPRFAMTTKHCVAHQLDGAFAALAEQNDPALEKFFTKVGGSFNWRVIAGTQRLSSHSFGIALDLNTELGGYWRWEGAREGSVGSYDNRYPKNLVSTLERFGFIWGGKWHHYDGMHFEYRPELILHARLLAQ
ncbi:MAG: M15 family peptidase [Rhodobacteraceae bacterium]|nr:MAG: M15 family peptidase [Paracoccaceae bacterium]